jgi:hypothetical protein
MEDLLASTGASHGLSHGVIERNFTAQCHWKMTKDKPAGNSPGIPQGGKKPPIQRGVCQPAAEQLHGGLSGRPHGYMPNPL